MAFDPKTDLATKEVQDLYAAAAAGKAPVDRAAAAAVIQDCAIALLQLGRFFNAGGVHVSTAKGVRWMGSLAPIDPKTLAATILAAGPKGEQLLDDVALLELATQMKGALQ